MSHWLGHRQLTTTQIYPSTGSGRRIDGANPEVRADYQTAMQRLSEAESRDSRTVPETEALASSSSQAEPPPRADSAVAPPLTAQAIADKVSDLPAWLRSPLVDFLLAKQVRWPPYHRRSRARQWVGELRRAWTWLLQERQVTGFADLSRRDLSAYLTHCHERELASGTLNHFLTTFWSFLRFLEDRDAPIAPGLYRVPRPQEPDWQPRPLSEAEYARLEQAVLAMTANDTPEAAALDRSWFFILSDGGLRISEMLTLTVGDWGPQAQTLRIRHAKGHRERRVPVTDRTAQAIEVHLAGRSAEPQAPLLMRRERAVHADYVRQRLHAFAAQADVEGVTPHRLRHTYATRLLNGGRIRVTSLQKLMGHQRIDTTMIYAAIYDETLQSDYEAAMARLQARFETDPDWDLWGPTVEAAFQTEAETTGDPEPDVVTVTN